MSDGQHPTAEPVVPQGHQFHRLFRGIPKYRWWKPLVFGVLSIIFGFTLTQIVTTLLILPVSLEGGMDALLDFQNRIMALDTQDPYAIAVAFLSLAVWIPAIIFAAWASGIKPIGRIWSVEFRIRSRYLMATIWPALAALIVAQMIGIGIQMVIDPIDPNAEVPTGPDNFQWNLALTTIALALVLVPFQAAAEELMFRGAMMQILGSWLKSPIIPILLPSVAFAFAHLYDPWALVQVGLMGVVCGWLTWRTGGLEAAISLHTVNNLVVFLILATGITGETSQVQETGASVVSALIQALMLGGYAWWAVRIYDRKYRPRYEPFQRGLAAGQVTA